MIVMSGLDKVLTSLAAVEIPANPPPIIKILEFPNDSEFININNQNDYEKALSYIRINNNYNN